MSRIDEALKRASQGPVAGRTSARGAEAQLRLADELTLNEYPLENRASSSGVDRVDVPIDYRAPAPDYRAPAPAPTRRAVRQPGGAISIGSNEKLVVGAGRNDVSMEQYRRLAATLHEAQVEKGLKTVMVTSAVPKEGKTLTVVNLALTLSESYGRRVVLIDADLRRPSVHEILGIPNEKGLSEVLRSDRIEPPLLQVSSHLSVLPSGRPEQNPLAGLSSDRMRQLLEDFSARFDWVLLDTPPVGLLSDAQLLGRLAQAAIFVIRASSTPFPVVERAIAELGRDCIIGTVLNGVEEETISNSQYGDYYKGD